MAFKSLFALVSLVAAVSAAPPAAPLVTCPDGNKASHAACCPLFALRDDLQANLYVSLFFDVNIN